MNNPVASNGVFGRIKESIFPGIVGIVLGIGIFIKTSEILLVLILIGITLILFHKEKNKL